MSHVVSGSQGNVYEVPGGPGGGARGSKDVKRDVRWSQMVKGQRLGGPRRLRGTFNF